MKCEMLRFACVEALHALHALQLELRARKPETFATATADRSAGAAMRFLVERGEIALALFEMGTVCGVLEGLRPDFVGERKRLVSHALRLSDFVRRRSPVEVTEACAEFRGCLSATDSSA